MPCRINLLYWSGQHTFVNIADQKWHATGFGVDQVTAKGGSRWSTYKAFIEPVLHRENLKVLKYSTVEKVRDDNANLRRWQCKDDKILFNAVEYQFKVHFDKNNRAYGVTFKRHGRHRFARASKEVILSAGAIDSPKILMLSGVGPKKHLQSIGVSLCGFLRHILIYEEEHEITIFDLD